MAAIPYFVEYFSVSPSMRMKYATFGVSEYFNWWNAQFSWLQPPVLMVAGTLAVDTDDVSYFGWTAAIAVPINPIGATMIFCKRIGTDQVSNEKNGYHTWPPTIAHVIFLMAVVIFPINEVYSGLFLFFLGLSHAYENIKIDLYCAKHY